VSVCLLSSAACTKENQDICSESPGELFERRIEPLLSADHPNTCAECHAGGLDLESFLRSDSCESMACLKAEGLVNLEHPAQSVLLSFLDRATPTSELITKEIIAEERDAFLSWIEHESKCQGCADAICEGRDPSSCERDSDLGAVLDPTNDPGDCDRTTIERLFRGTIYESRSRCTPCHVKEELAAAPDAPRWLFRTGECEVASLATLRAIEDSGYIDVEQPESSLLILKPLAEFQGGVAHGGHDKFVKGNDPAYDAFIYFVTRYGACQTGSAPHN